jgi:alpha-D-ribose 1-methylphosphonate 5-triphosphate synthase subunit PhnH
MDDPHHIELIAKLAYEANAAYCRSIGDTSQPAWENAPEWQKTSVINGVRFHIENPIARASTSHENWLNEKQANGWHYGPEKDPERKTHPCMVPFDELPIEQQIKDHIFRSVVHACILVGT